MAATAESAAPVKKGGKGALLVLIVVGLLSAGAGFALPRLMGSKEAAKPAALKAEKKPVVIPFGNENIVVNLRHASGGRFIRVKLLLVVDATEEKTITELVTKQKPFMKTWLIGYLADQSVEEVLRTTGINRIRREIRDQFNALLFPDGSEKVLDVLFDDFLVQ